MGVSWPKNFYFRYNGSFSHFLFEEINFSLSAYAYAYQTHIRTKLSFYNFKIQNVPTFLAFGVSWNTY